MIAYTINGKQPVWCSIIRDEPMFYDLAAEGINGELEDLAHDLMDFSLEADCKGVLPFVQRLFDIMDRKQ